MIARIWHGRVPSTKAEQYREITAARAIRITICTRQSEGLYSRAGAREMLSTSSP